MKNKTSKSKVANKVTGLQEFLDSLSKPKMKKGGNLPEFSGDGRITQKDVLMGRGVIPKPKGQKGWPQKENGGSGIFWPSRVEAAIDLFF